LKERERHEGRKGVKKKVKEGGNRVKGWRREGRG
jgi:hypothetical protein